VATRQKRDQAQYVTVLMPCRNAHPDFLREALTSVFAQTAVDWKLLVIDDASDDAATLETLAALVATPDPRVRVVRSEGKSVTTALNTGMRHATTGYVCVLHCDDLLDPTAIAVLARWIDDRPDIDYFYSSRMFVDEEGRPLSGVYAARPFHDVRELERGCPVKPLHCWRLDSALAIGGMDETFGLHGGDDYDFVWSMADAGYTFAGIPDCLYYIRDHRAHYRLTTHVPLDTQVRELAGILRKHGVPESRVGAEIERRKRGYLRQALFETEDDRLAKERSRFDIASGWREPHASG
jgi:glycosyltransferase involved in cell wall biosynthesis